MYSQDEVLVKVNELAKMYLSSLKRSRYGKDEKEQLKVEYLRINDDLIKKVKDPKPQTKNPKPKTSNQKTYNKANGNRWSAKKFFLTISKTDAPKGKVLDYYLKNMNLSKAAIAREKHKDGTNHLHVYVEFVVKKDIKNVKFFNLPDEFTEYGNISVNVDTIRKHTKENIYSYMLKTDKNVFSYGFNIRQDAYGKLKPKEVWYKVSIGEWNLGDVVKYDPSYLTKNLIKLNDRISDNLKFLSKYFNVDFVF